MEPVAVLRLLVQAQGAVETRAQLARLEAEARKTSSSTDKLEKSFSRVTNSTHSFNKSMEGLANVWKIVKWPTYIAGAGMAAQAVGALGAATVAAASAVAPLAGAYAGVVGLYAALGQGGLVAKLALNNVGKALQGNQAAMKKLTPTGQEFVRQLQGMKGQVAGLQAVAQKGLFPGLLAALKILSPMMSRFAPIIGATARMLGSLAVTAGQMLRQMGPQLLGIAKNNIAVLGNMGMAALDLGHALINVLSAARPFTLWLSDVIHKGATWIMVQVQAGQASGKLAGFLEKTRQVMTTLGHIIFNLAAGFYQIGKAAAPLGRDLLASFQKLTAQFRTWSESVSGKNQLAIYFRDAKQPIYALFNLIGSLGKALLQLTQPSHLTTGLFAGLQKLVPVLKSLIQSTVTQFGPALISILTGLGKLLASLAGSSGPLTATATALGKLAGGLASIINGIPGLRSSIFLIGGFAASTKIITLLLGPFAKGLAALEVALYGQAAATQTANDYTLRQRVQLAALAIQEKLTAAWTWLSTTATKAWTLATNGALLATIRERIALAAAKVQMIAMAAVTRVVTAAQWLWNLALEANPIVLVVTAIAAFVAALVVLYVKVKFVHNAINAAWNFLKAATVAVWGAIKVAVLATFHAIVAAWNSVLKPAFNAIVWFIKNVMVPIWKTEFAIAKAYVLFIFHAIVAIWNNVLKPAFQAIVWFIKNILVPIWKTEFNIAKTIVFTVFHAIVGVWNNVLKPVFGFIANAVRTLGQVFSKGFTFILNTVKSIVGTVVGFLRGAWNTIINGVTAFATQIANGVADGVKGALNLIIGFIDVIIGILNNLPFISIKPIAKIGGSPTAPPPGTALGPGGPHAPRPAHARGGLVTHPMYMVGEEAPMHPEFVISTNPRDRKRMRPLAMAAARAVGVPGFQLGGIPSDILHGLSAVPGLGQIVSLFGGGPSPLSLVQKGLDLLLSKVAPALPAWLSSLGSHLIDGAKAYAATQAAKAAKAARSAAPGVGNIPPGSGPVEAQMYKAGISLGLSKLAIAGMIGNAVQESSLNPSVNICNTPTDCARGLFSWNSTNPQYNLVQLGNIPQQMALAASAISIPAFNAAATSPAAAAAWFEMNFEHAGIVDMANRIAAANAAFAAGYAGGGIPGCGGPGCACGGKCSKLLPYGGSFATGGVVPGPTGAPRMIVAHGGETVSSNSTRPLLNIEQMNVQDAFDERALAHRLAFLLEM